MNQKLIATLLLIFCLQSISSTAQFYKTVTDTSYVLTESSAITLNDGFVFGFTESNAKQNFHDNILLVKTNTSGNITWSKTYDAGTGKSIHLIEMLHTANNEILISAITGLDNNFTSNNTCLLKINPDGTVVWVKKYTSVDPLDSRGLVQLKDGSFVAAINVNNNNPGIIQVDNNGAIIAAAKITNRLFQSTKSITAKGNTADIVVANTNIANINFKTGVISNQKQYNTSNQFTALLSTRCKNGDIAYVAGRTQGGVLNGTSRVFRTTANGNLLWAKNITAFIKNDHLPFSIFDIVTQVSIHEDINGNVVAVVEDESLQSLLIVFDAAGNYLYHRFLYTNYNFLAELPNGTYLHSSVPSISIAPDPIISNRSLSSITNCDSTIFVTITNGTDSAATLDKLIFSRATITATDVPLSVHNVTKQQNVFCNLSALKNTNHIKDAMVVTVMPNPAAVSIIVKAVADIPFSIYNMNGILLLTSVTNHSTNIASLTPGLYMIEVKTKNEVIRRTLIKQ